MKPPQFALGIVFLVCCTFLLAKNCDYQHMEDMKKIESKIPKPEASCVPH